MWCYAEGNMKEKVLSKFEKEVIGFLERRKGQPIDDHLINAFAVYLRPKRVNLELTAMRHMVRQ
jgi:hypothetical protein